MSITIKIEIDGNEVLNQNIEETKNDKPVSPVLTGMVSYSQYARFFNEACPGWEKDPECNLMYLLQQQHYANAKLKANGFLFLNDVYGMLGFPKTKAGQIVGWIYKENNTDGDNYVDFGIYRTDANSKFVNLYENSILLDFNVDGPIIDKI